MKEYLKMGDVFDYNVKGIDLKRIASDGLIDTLELAAHAINSHDCLVENYQAVNKECKMWEERACKEASRVKDLEEFLHHFLDNSHNVDLGGADFTATTCEALIMGEKLDDRTYPDLWPGH